MDGFYSARTGIAAGAPVAHFVTAMHKRVIAYYGNGEFDTAKLTSNTFEIEWPPRSGRLQTFPEVDRAEWFDLDIAKSKILSSQVELIERLAQIGL